MDLYQPAPPPPPPLVVNTLLRIWSACACAPAPPMYTAPDCKGHIHKVCVFTSGVIRSRGARRAWAQALDADSPPPPPREIGTGVGDVGAKGTGEKVSLRQGVKTCFHPMCLYSKYSEFHEEFNHG